MPLHSARMFAPGKLLALALLAGLAAPSPCPAQGGQPQVNFTRETRFRIPFIPEGAVQRLREVELHYSTDQGRTWQFVQRAQANQRGFDFQAERQGLYGFTVRTIDIDGRANPPSMDGQFPQLLVYVDTQAPVVKLNPITLQGSFGVDWDIQDENLDLSTFRLEWRPPGAAAWQSLTVEAPVAKGSKTWAAGTVAVDSFRITVQDRAKNLGEGTTSMSGRQSDNRSYPPENQPGGQARPATRLVNSTKINLNYAIEDIGPSGATLELWATRDRGNTWNRMLANMPEKPPCVVPVPEEGVYGFTIVARSKVNLGDRPPQAGEPAQFWVEVDLTPPKVTLAPVEVGREGSANKVTIRWRAEDKNLDERPVRLEFVAVRKDGVTEHRVGTWQEMAGELPREGQYVWSVPGDGVYYHVRAVVKDKANNVGQAETQRAVVVDLSRPRGRIIDVEPAKGDAASPEPGNTFTVPRNP